MEVTMKKQLLFNILIILCLISISVNVLLGVKYNNAKKSIFFWTYGQLVNVSKVLDSLEYSLSTDNSLVNYNLSLLEQECIKLDDSISGLAALSPNNMTYWFKDFNRLISRTVTTNGDTEKTKNDIIQYREKILELLKKLSPGEKLNDDGYGDLYITPNYSLSIKQIINLISDTLSDILQDTDGRSL